MGRTETERFAVTVLEERAVEMQARARRLREWADEEEREAMRILARPGRTQESAAMAAGG